MVYIMQLMTVERIHPKAPVMLIFIAIFTCLPSCINLSSIYYTIYNIHPPEYYMHSPELSINHKIQKCIGRERVKLSRSLGDHCIPNKSNKRWAIIAPIFPVKISG